MSYSVHILYSLFVLQAATLGKNVAVNHFHTFRWTAEINEEFNNAHFKWPPPFNGKPVLGYWTVFGEHKCTVGIQCTLIYNGDCNKSIARVKVSDGSKGEQVYCGNLTFKNRPSEQNLRDMFMKITAPYYNRMQVNCTAKCDDGSDFTPLPNVSEAKSHLGCVCGLSLNNRDGNIVAGNNYATINEYPWQVALVVTNTRISFCGGTIINDRVIVTARHCLEHDVNYNLDKVEVLVHAHNLSQAPPAIFNTTGMSIDESVLKEDAEERTQRIKVAGFVIPDFAQPYIADFDIALLRLARKINLGSADGPTSICLPPSNEHAIFNDKLVGKMLTATGWGLAENNLMASILRKVDVPYIPDEECIESLKNISKIPLTPRMMCAYFQNTDTHNVNTCKGDSGGPLTFRRNNQTVQVGVTSYGGDCNIRGSHAVYTKVSDLMQWISYHSNEWNANWCQGLWNNTY